MDVYPTVGPSSQRVRASDGIRITPSLTGASLRHKYDRHPRWKLRGIPNGNELDPLGIHFIESVKHKALKTYFSAGAKGRGKYSTRFNTSANNNHYLVR